ncbi:hypothetical protein GF420_11255, partial [candidate division GN15 bacterium]|nr:hypothetical protein [candidate division GN15 bacterium]
DADDVLTLAQTIRDLPSVQFRGLMTHAGHAYGASSDHELAGIGRAEGEQLLTLAEHLCEQGVSVATISVGSTPTARHVVAVTGITELRVGNYIFNDMMQVALGSAEIDQCALTVLATVISMPTNDRAVIDAGSKALGLDRGAHGKENIRGFGTVVGRDMVISRLSEEHGVIELPGHGLALGERVRIIPNHACPVVNLYDRAYLVDGEAVVESLPISARRRSIEPPAQRSTSR